MMIHPLIPLFRAFDSGDVEELHRATDRYVNGFAKIGAQGININTEGRWEQGVLKGRKQVFAEMSAMQALSKTFFSDYCPDVEWEKDMRFSLISSGKSRVSFLVARNIAYVPVWMDKKEWNDFYHEDAVKKIHDYLKKNGFAELFAPLPHPAFMHMTYKCYDFQFLWLEKSGRYLAEYIFEQTKGFYFEKYSALYAMEDLGITERLYASQGLHSYRYGEIGELEKLCDGLFYYKPEIYLGREVDFSYVSMKYREKIKDILINTTEICFLLDDRDEMETKREIEDCGFTIKTVLFAAYWSDKEVHGIVLQRERIDGKNAGN